MADIRPYLQRIVDRFANSGLQSALKAALPGICNLIFVTRMSPG
jgi:hypothetical protein